MALAMNPIGLRRLHLFRRTVAAVFDYTLLLIPIWLITKHYGVPGDDGVTRIEGLPGLLLAVAPTSILIAQEALFGRTLGKWFSSLRVASGSLKPPSFSQCLRRRLLDPIDFCMCLAPAILMVKLTPSNQRLGDLWAHTWVVGTEDEAPFKTSAA
jgi:uncharacterized RDD family membrane protein YckC